MWSALFQGRDPKGTETSDTADEDLDLDSYTPPPGEKERGQDVRPGEEDIFSEDSDDYVPPSLRSFVGNLEKTLEQNQAEFREIQLEEEAGEGDGEQRSHGSADPVLDAISSPDSSQTPPLVHGMTESQVKRAALGYTPPEQKPPRSKFAEPIPELQQDVIVQPSEPPQQPLTPARTPAPLLDTQLASALGIRSPSTPDSLGPQPQTPMSLGPQPDTFEDQPSQFFPQQEESEPQQQSSEASTDQRKWTSNLLLAEMEIPTVPSENLLASPEDSGLENIFGNATTTIHDSTKQTRLDPPELKPVPEPEPEFVPEQQQEPVLEIPVSSEGDKPAEPESNSTANYFPMFNPNSTTARMMATFAPTSGPPPTEILKQRWSPVAKAVLAKGPSPSPVTTPATATVSGAAAMPPPNDTTEMFITSPPADSATSNSNINQGLTSVGSTASSKSSSSLTERYLFKSANDKVFQHKAAAIKAAINGDAEDGHPDTAAVTESSPKRKTPSATKSSSSMKERALLKMAESKATVATPENVEAATVTTPTQTVTTKDSIVVNLEDIAFKSKALEESIATTSVGTKDVLQQQYAQQPHQTDTTSSPAPPNKSLMDRARNKMATGKAVVDSALHSISSPTAELIQPSSAHIEHKESVQETMDVKTESGEQYTNATKPSTPPKPTGVGTEMVENATPISIISSLGVDEANLPPSIPEQSKKAPLSLAALASAHKPTSPRFHEKLRSMTSNKTPSSASAAQASTKSGSKGATHHFAQPTAASLRHETDTHPEEEKHPILSPTTHSAPSTAHFLQPTEASRRHKTPVKDRESGDTKSLGGQSIGSAPGKNVVPDRSVSPGFLQPTESSKRHVTPEKVRAAMEMKTRPKTPTTTDAPRFLQRTETSRRHKTPEKERARSSGMPGFLQPTETSLRHKTPDKERKPIVEVKSSARESVGSASLTAARFLQPTEAFLRHKTPEKERGASEPKPAPTFMSSPSIHLGAMHFAQPTEASQLHFTTTDDKDSSPHNDNVPPPVNGKSSVTEFSAQSTESSRDNIHGKEETAAKAEAAQEDKNTDEISALIGSLSLVDKDEATPSQRDEGAHHERTPSISDQGTSVCSSTARLFIKATVPVVSSRLLQQTAVSKAHHTPEEAKAKVRERVSKHSAVEQEKHPLLINEKIDNTITSKFNADEARARAKERVRQAQLRRKALEEKENKTKTNQITRPTAATSRLTTSTTTRRPRIVTKTEEEPTLAQSSDVMRRGLRDDRSTVSGNHKSRHTIPISPKFATTARMGEHKHHRNLHDVSLAQSSDVMMKHLRHDEVSTCSSDHRSRGLTIPYAPHFTTTDKYGEKPVSAQGPKKENSLACSSQVLASMLRGNDPPPKIQRDLKPTIPIEPKFHKISKRALPKSTEEREKEMMEQHQPFKARPLKQSVVAPKPVKRVAKPAQKRELTHAKPSKLNTEKRVVEKPSTLKNGKAEKPKAAAPKTFKARPVPDFSKAPKAISKAPKVALTKKVAAAASATRSLTSPSTVGKTEETKPFKARPLPRSTFSAPPGTPRATTPSNVSTAEVEESKPFKALPLPKSTFVPPTPTTPRASEATPAVSPKALTAKPFQLKSSERHEAYRKQMEEKLKQEEEERQKLTKFHARPFTKSPAAESRPNSRSSDKHPTSPQPFQLKSLARKEAQEGARQRKLAQEEEERKRQATFKAKPVPKTTYAFKPVSPRALPPGMNESSFQYSRKHPNCIPSEVHIPSPLVSPIKPIGGFLNSSPTSGFNQHPSFDETLDAAGEDGEERHHHTEGSDDAGEVREEDLVGEMMRLRIAEGK